MQLIPIISTTNKNKVTNKPERAIGDISLNTSDVTFVAAGVWSNLGIIIMGFTMITRFYLPYKRAALSSSRVILTWGTFIDFISLLSWSNFSDDVKNELIFSFEMATSFNNFFSSARSSLRKDTSSTALVAGCSLMYWRRSEEVKRGWWLSG